MDPPIGTARRALPRRPDRVRGDRRGDAGRVTNSTETTSVGSSSTAGGRRWPPFCHDTSCERRRCGRQRARWSGEPIPPRTTSSAPPPPLRTTAEGGRTSWISVHPTRSDAWRTESRDRRPSGGASRRRPRSPSCWTARRRRPASRTPCRIRFRPARPGVGSTIVFPCDSADSTPSPSSGRSGMPPPPVRSPSGRPRRDPAQRRTAWPHPPTCSRHGRRDRVRHPDRLQRGDRRTAELQRRSTCARWPGCTGSSSGTSTTSLDVRGLTTDATTGFFNRRCGRVSTGTGRRAAGGPHPGHHRNAGGAAVTYERPTPGRPWRFGPGTPCGCSWPTTPTRTRTCTPTACMSRPAATRTTCC